MKRYTFLLFAFLLPALAWSQAGKEIRIPFSNPGEKGKVNIRVNRGSVNIKGSDHREVLVSYQTRNGEALKLVGDKDGLQKIVGGVPNIKISEGDNQIWINSEDLKNTVDFTILVPRKTDLEMWVMMDGQVVISDIEGEITSECVNGPITATGISGTLIANSFNGDIKIEYDKVTTDTPLSYTTYNGNLDLTFPADFKANLKMRSDNGEIFTGFNMELSQGNFKDDKGTYVDGWIKGQINGGGPEIMLKNYTGNIYIRKKE